MMFLGISDENRIEQMKIEIAGFHDLCAQKDAEIERLRTELEQASKQAEQAVHAAGVQTGEALAEVERLRERLRKMIRSIEAENSL